MVHQRVSTQSGHHGDYQPLLCAPCCSCCPFLSSARRRRRPAWAAVGHLQRPTAELPVAASQASSSSSSPSATIHIYIHSPRPIPSACQPLLRCNVKQEVPPPPPIIGTRLRLKNRARGGVKLTSNFAMRGCCAECKGGGGAGFGAVVLRQSQ